MSILLARHVHHEDDRLQRPELVFGEHFPFVFPPVHGRQAAIRSHGPIESPAQDVVVTSQIRLFPATGPFRRMVMVRDDSPVMRGEEPTDLSDVTGLLDEENVRVDVF